MAISQYIGSITVDVTPDGYRMIRTEDFGKFCKEFGGYFAKRDCGAPSTMGISVGLRAVEVRMALMDKNIESIHEQAQAAAGAAQSACNLIAGIERAAPDVAGKLRFRKDVEDD